MSSLWFSNVSSNNFIPNRIQQYNTVCMSNLTNSGEIIDIVAWFCWWPPEKQWAYQAGLFLSCLLLHSRDKFDLDDQFRPWFAMAKFVCTVIFHVQVTLVAQTTLKFVMTSSNGNIFRVTCPLCRELVNSPHKGQSQWRGALMFSLICAWANSWVNNRDAGDLRRYCAHYDVTVMSLD